MLSGARRPSVRRDQGNCVVSGPVFYCWPAVGSLTIWNALHSWGLIILRRAREMGEGPQCPMVVTHHLSLNTMAPLLFNYCLPWRNITLWTLCPFVSLKRSDFFQIYRCTLCTMCSHSFTFQDEFELALWWEDECLLLWVCVLSG